VACCLLRDDDAAAAVDIILSNVDGENGATL